MVTIRVTGSGHSSCDVQELGSGHDSRDGYWSWTAYRVVVLDHVKGSGHDSRDVHCAQFV